MANRRMFSKDITNSDHFIDMPLSSQALYFHLGMNADDDGFVSPKGICRLIQAKDDDLKMLAMKGFVIFFEDSVIVITHRKTNNEIKKDRHKQTIYKEHLKVLGVTEGKYTMSPECLQDVSKMSPQVSIGKDSIGKDSIYSSTNVEEEQSSLLEEGQEVLEGSLLPLENPPPTPPAEYTPKEITIQIDHIVEKIKEACKKYGVIYGYDSKERQYAKHLLSEKFKRECLDQVGLSMDDFIDGIIGLGTKLRFGKVINNPMSLYYNWADNINKSNQQNIHFSPTKRVVVLK